MTPKRSYISCHHATTNNLFIFFVKSWTRNKKYKGCSCRTPCKISLLQCLWNSCCISSFRRFMISKKSLSTHDQRPIYWIFIYWFSVGSCTKMLFIYSSPQHVVIFKVWVWCHSRCVNLGLTKARHSTMEKLLDRMPIEPWSFGDVQLVRAQRFEIYRRVIVSCPVNKDLSTDDSFLPRFNISHGAGEMGYNWPTWE